MILNFLAIDMNCDTGIDCSDHEPDTLSADAIRAKTPVGRWKIILVAALADAENRCGDSRLLHELPEGGLLDGLTVLHSTLGQLPGIPLARLFEKQNFPLRTSLGAEQENRRAATVVIRHGRSVGGIRDKDYGSSARDRFFRKLSSLPATEE